MPVIWRSGGRTTAELARIGVLALALLLLLPVAARAQVTGRGTEFWACWPRSHLSLETSAELVVLADEATDVAVDGAFTWPATTVGPGAPLVVPIPESLRIASGRVIVPSGFRVRTLDPLRPISVLLRVPRQAEASDDIARVLGVEELGTRYIVTSYGAALPNEPSFYAVVATQDATTVNADVPCAATTDTVVLDAGEVYQVFCQWTSSPSDVTGSIVTADKPVAVFGGNSDAFVPKSYLSGDFLVEAMIPVSRWGRDYYLTPHPKGPGAVSGDDIARIVAAGPGSVDYAGPSGTGTFVSTAPGDFTDLQYAGEAHLTSTSTDFSVHVFQTGIEMSDFGDPFMIQVPPVTDYAVAYRLYTPPFYSLGTFLNVVTTTTGAAGVRVNGQPVAGPWTPLPGGTHAWARVDLGFLGPEHFVIGPEPMAVLVHGYNDEYLPDPDLGEVPGAYGYPAPHADPGCAVFPIVVAPQSACVGLPIRLTGAGSSSLGCTALQYRWLKNGTLVVGCDTFDADSTCDTLFDGPATYTLEASCVDDPACSAALAVTIPDEPARPVVLAPNPAQICAGDTIQLTASAGFDEYRWTSNPGDPGVTPRQGAASSLDATPDVTTTYTVEAFDARGCASLTTLVVQVTQDALPPALADSVRVTKEAPAEVRLRWRDLALQVGRYEVTSLECPTRDTCAQDPDSPTMDAAAVVVGPVAPGVETLVHANAQSLGGLIFYQVRATSPCRNSPGPTCNGWPMQFRPCP